MTEPMLYNEADRTAAASERKKRLAISLGPALLLFLTAVALFVFSNELHLLQALVLGAGAVGGGWLGAQALHRVNERALRIAVVAIGLALTVGLFMRPV